MSDRPVDSAAGTVRVLTRDECIDRLAPLIVDLRRWRELEQRYGNPENLRDQISEYLFLLGEDDDIDRYMEAEK